jgi:hypothetical protein
MTTPNARTTYESFRLVRNGDDAVLEVSNLDGTLREIGYEEFLMKHYDFDLLRDGKKMQMEWIAEMFWDVRRGSGLKHVLGTLTEIFGKDNFALWQPTFIGRYVCQVGNLENQEKEFDEEYAWMMENIESIVGTPAIPELVFTGNREDGKCGWELSFTETDEEVFAFAEWNDIEGIISLTKIFSDPEACLSAFATALPEEHALFVAQQAYRKQNEEAIKLIGVDKRFHYTEFSKEVLALSKAYQSEHPYISGLDIHKVQMDFWQEQASPAPIAEYDDERYDYYNPTARRPIGATITFTGKNTPEGNRDTQKLWDSIRETAQSLGFGYAFIDRTDANQSTDSEVFVRKATVVINRAFYEAMGEKYFHLAESLETNPFGAR